MDSKAPNEPLAVVMLTWPAKPDFRARDAKDDEVAAAREPRPQIERVEILAAKILPVAVAVILGLVGFWSSAQDCVGPLGTVELQNIQEQLSYPDLPIWISK